MSEFDAIHTPMSWMSIQASERLARPEAATMCMTSAVRHAVSVIAAAGLLMTLNAPLQADDDTLNPKLPSKLSSERFTERLNRGDDVDTVDTADEAVDETKPLVVIDSYGNERFVDVVEVKPSGGAPSYYLEDRYGEGTPSAYEESSQKTPAVSKWRLGGW